MDNYIDLTAVFSRNHTGGFHAYIEEFPELSINAASFDKAISNLSNKLQRAVKDTRPLRVAVRYKHVFIKNKN